MVIQTREPGEGMSIAMYHRKDGICFVVSGATCQRILDWEHALDKIVFDEQLTTGSFRGRYPVDDELQTVMLIAKAEGRIMPYYGAGGSRGSYVYTLQWTGARCIIKIENEIVEESIELAADAEVGADSAMLVSEEPQLIFKINGKELENLRRWRCWYEDQASTSRYIYRFGQASIGRLGYTIKVEDTKTGNAIDVTAYEEW